MGNKAKIATGTILGTILGATIGSYCTYFVMKKKNDEAIKVQLLRNDELCRQLYKPVVANAKKGQKNASKGHSDEAKPVMTGNKLKPLEGGTKMTADEYFKYDSIVSDYVKTSDNEEQNPHINSQSIVEEYQHPSEEIEEPLLLRYTGLDSEGSTQWEYINVDETKLLMSEEDYWNMAETCDYIVDDDAKYILYNLLYFKDGTIAKASDIKPIEVDNSSEFMLGVENLKEIKSLFEDKTYGMLYVRDLANVVDYEIEYVDEDYETYTA